MRQYEFFCYLGKMLPFGLGRGQATGTVSHDAVECLPHSQADEVFGDHRRVQLSQVPVTRVTALL